MQGWQVLSIFVVIVLGLVGLIGWCVWRFFRKKRKAKDGKDGKIPADTEDDKDDLQALVANAEEDLKEEDKKPGKRWINMNWFIGCFNLDILYTYTKMHWYFCR